MGGAFRGAAAVWACIDGGTVDMVKKVIVATESQDLFGNPNGEHLRRIVKYMFNAVPVDLIKSVSREDIVVFLVLTTNFVTPMSYNRPLI